MIDFSKTIFPIYLDLMTPQSEKKNIIDGMQNPLGTSRSDQMKTVYCWWDENCRYQLIEWKSLLDENYSGFLLNEQDCMLGGGGDVICCTRRFLHPLLSLSFYFRKEETQSWRRKPRIEEGGPKRLASTLFWFSLLIMPLQFFRIVFKIRDIQEHKKKVQTSRKWKIIFSSSAFLIFSLNQRSNWSRIKL